MSLKPFQIRNNKDMYEFVMLQLGFPVVKVELVQKHIDTSLARAMDLFLLWAPGVVTEKKYSTLLLESGVSEYTLEEGTIEILSISDGGSGPNGINTLFTIDNAMYTAGILDFRDLTNSNQGLLNYHMALDLKETIDRYTSTGYQWTYDTYSRKLTLSPAPSGGSTRSVADRNGYTKDVVSPGYLLFEAEQFKGTGSPGFNMQNAYITLYNQAWIREYTVALCKIILGLIRRKYQNFGSIGNTGLNLDGDSIISEGISEKEQLEDQLKSGIYAQEGYSIITGII